jgi:hypothetical protein
MEFEVVERPIGSGKVSNELIEALKKTLGTTSAVRMKLTPNTFVTWQANVRAQLRTQYNLRLRTKHNKATSIVTAWAEHFDVREMGGAISDADLGVTEAGFGPSEELPEDNA